MRRRVGATYAEWHRFLWRRHVQKILHWGEHREEGNLHGFMHNINWLLQVVLFLDKLRGTRDHGQDASGGTGGGAELVRGVEWG